MSISCIVIDDELPAIQQMENYIGRVPFLNLLKSFDNGIEPMSFLQSNKVDLIFLDIEMEGFTGLQLIKTLHHKPKIILTTAYDQYALAAFDLNVSDYLLKPISFERFMQSVDKIFDFYAKTGIVFRCFLVPVSSPGPPSVREPPATAPGMVPDPIFNDFCQFLDHQNKKHGGGFCAQRTEIIEN